MAWVLLMLSDQHEDVRDLLDEFPLAPYTVRQAPLKGTTIEDLIPTHPDLILLDATVDPAAAEDAARTLSVAWEIGLPPVIAILEESGVARFRLDKGVDDFLLVTATSAEISARLAMAYRRAGHGDEAAVLKVGDLTVNPENYQV